jgi:putative transposase
MNNNEYEEQLRIKAVKRYLKGENPSRIYKSFNRSKGWFYKWLNRYKDGDSLWYKNLPRVPKTIHKSVDPHTEELIIKVRKRLEDTKYSQIGAGAIAWELTKLNIKPPKVWTINRILKRNNLIKKRKKGYQPKGKTYPSIKIDIPNRLHQTDLIGPRYLYTKERLYSLNTMDIFRRKVKIKSIPFRDAFQIMKTLIEVWKTLGIPEYCQFDNQQVFAGSERRPRWFSRVIKLCLSLGIEPVFIPFREPWRMAELEHFNDVWDKRFFRTQRFRSLNQIQEEEKKFEDFHNNNHCYSALKGMTPKAFEKSLNFKPNLLDPEFTIKNIEYCKEGKIHIVRFIRSDKILNIFGEKFRVSPVCQYEYVKATIHLKEELLRVFLFEDLVHEFKYNLPKK